jgi:hypothetical protein
MISVRKHGNSLIFPVGRFLLRNAILGAPLKTLIVVLI